MKDKVTIELDRKGIELFRDFLGRTNFYVVASVLTREANKIDDEDLDIAWRSVLRAYKAVDDACSNLE